MAFQKDPALYHSALVKAGPKLVTVASAPKDVKNGQLCLVELLVDGVKHVYFIDTKEIRAGFEANVGKQVVLIADGNSKQGTAKIQFQDAGGGVGQPARQQQAATQSTSALTEQAAKKALCQSANLMRLAVKKANDIAVELSLGDDHRQGIATTLFLQNKHFIEAMPLQPFTKEQLGYGASSEPEPEQEEEPPF